MEHVALTCEKLNEKKIDPKVVLIQLQEIPWYATYNFYNFILWAYFTFHPQKVSLKRHFEIKGKVSRA